jgi:dipeptidyl-peptidase-4
VILGPVYANTVRNRWVDREEWRGAFNTLQEYFALEGGYIGFHVDVRGSVGYGSGFEDRLLRDYGGIDVEDIHSAVEYLKTLPYVDAARIGIWGSSYGGLMTAMSLFKKPGVYAAGVAGAPATNVRHATTGEVKVARLPGDPSSTYDRMSAVTHAAGLRDPLLIIHGMQDDVVLFKDSVTLAEALLRSDRTTFEFAFVPSSVHNWTLDPHYARYLLGRLAAHFDRFLKPPGPGASPR